MQIAIDREVCVACGACVLAGPDVFDQDEEEGRAILLIEDPDESYRDQVLDSIDACPVGALSLVEAPEGVSP